MIKMTKLPLEETAEIQFEKGRKKYAGIQIWNELSLDYFKQELREEVADAYNYSEDHPKKRRIRRLLRAVYKLI